jgi:hypothetical protein
LFPLRTLQNHPCSNSKTVDFTCTATKCPGRPSDVEIDSEYQFERRRFSSSPEQLRSLAAWLLEQEAEEVVMESRAQYWKPVWEALERYWKPICETREGARRKSGTLHLAQALSNRGRRGRKRDFPDAERLVKPHLEDDPATPKPRLSNRTTESPTKPSTGAVIFDPGVPPAP